LVCTCGPVMIRHRARWRGAFAFALLFAAPWNVVGFVSLQTHNTRWARPVRLAAAESEKSAQGHPHTTESRAKISAANRGKTPWNKGVRHSEETRRLIGERTRLAMRRKKAEKLAAIGVTLEEWEAEQEKEKRETNERKKAPRAISDETRKKISDALKKRWQDPIYRTHRAQVLQASNRTRTGGVSHHSDETRRIISEKIKKRWRDPEYRTRVLNASNGTLSRETRDKIAATLKKRWQDPEFRTNMTKKISGARSEQHKQRIAAAIRSKWNQSDYRERTLAGISLRSQEARQARLAQGLPATAPRRPKPRPPSRKPVEVRQASVAPKRKPSRRKTPKEPTVGHVDDDHETSQKEAERRNRLRYTAPDLWAALYDDEDEAFV